MKYCQSCGTQIPDEAVFCPSCGKKVFVDPWASAPNANGSKTTSGNSSSKSFESEYCQSDNYSKNKSANPNPAPAKTIPPAMDSYSPLTIAGIVLAFLASLIGLILSVCAYNEAKRTGSEKNLSLSKTGIIVASVFMGLEVFIIFIVIILVIVGVMAGLTFI